VALGKLLVCNLCASVTKCYSLVPAKGVISLAEKVTAGLVGSNGSRPPSLQLRHPQADCQETGISSEPNTRNLSVGLLYFSLPPLGHLHTLVILSHPGDNVFSDEMFGNKMDGYQNHSVLFCLL